jgi:alpha-L-fucosidase
VANLCLSRKVGANYLLNFGPTAQGGLPEYESAALRATGRWMALHGDIVRQGKPVDCRCPGRDFLLKVGRRYYYFAFDLGIHGHYQVTIGASGHGPRAIAALPLKLKQARWVDNQEKLSFAQNGKTGDALLHLTKYPYGTDLVVRVAELE